MREGARERESRSGYPEMEAYEWVSDLSKGACQNHHAAAHHVPRKLDATLLTLFGSGHGKEGVCGAGLGEMRM